MAAILGDAAEVGGFLGRDAQGATRKGGPYGWDALTHLCFSRYLRLERARSEGFVSAAKALLNAGANANTGWMETEHEPRPTWESAMYGAAGIARHPELTRLLLEWGADPNDGETPYHVPETYDNTVMKILVESGKLTDSSVTTLLLPTSGPWMKLGEAADYVRAVRPEHMVSIHDLLLSETGKMINSQFLGEQGLTGIPLTQVDLGNSITL